MTLRLVLMLALLAPARGFAAPADSARVALRFERRDAFAVLGAGALVALAATRDRRWSADLGADGSQRARDLSLASRRLGDWPTVAAGLLASDGLARLARRPALGAAVERVAIACAASGVVTLAVKEAAGRSRPDEPPGGPGHFDPFSGHDAMPSGHATMAFALAAAVSAESRTAWVPAVLLPAAGVTAWGRVRDRRHWPSDVVAGAAIGGWTAYRVDGWARRRLPHGLWVIAFPRRTGAEVRAGVRF